MTTEELIRNACKAAGWRIKRGWPDSHRAITVWMNDAPVILKLADDDGDSRLLQVACQIGLHFEVIGSKWCAEAYSLENIDTASLCAYEPLGTEPLKAARMAVLRCAAMIGKTMK